MDLSGETAATKRLYGFDADFPHTRTFATQCLLEGAAKVIVANRTQSKIQAIAGVKAIGLKAADVTPKKA